MIIGLVIENNADSAYVLGFSCDLLLIGFVIVDQY